MKKYTFKNTGKSSLLLLGKSLKQGESIDVSEQKYKANKKLIGIYTKSGKLTMRTATDDLKAKEAQEKANKEALEAKEAQEKADKAQEKADKEALEAKEAQEKADKEALEAQTVEAPKNKRRRK